MAATAWQQLLCCGNGDRTTGVGLDRSIRGQRKLGEENMQLWTGGSFGEGFLSPNSSKTLRWVP